MNKNANANIEWQQCHRTKEKPDIAKTPKKPKKLKTKKKKKKQITKQQQVHTGSLAAKNEPEHDKTKSRRKGTTRQRTQ